MKSPGKLLFTLALFVSVSASADTVFTDNFQSGQYANWSLSGTGSDAINLYAGNYSLRHDGLRTAERAVSTAGFNNVTLSMDVAGLYLVAGDACYAEYSTDGGSAWSQLGVITSSQANGSFQTYTHNADVSLDDNPQLKVRFRAYTLYGNLCYGDNVTVTGTPVSGATTFFQEDFQDADYSDWTVSGNGNDVASLYQGNYSLRLDGLRQGELSVSTAGYTGVTLSGEMAALYLVNGDYCFVEYSTDSGQYWQTLLQVGNGQDNGVMRSASVSTGLDNQPDLKLRLRAYTLYGNYCYGDDVILTGTSGGGSGPSISWSGSGSFGTIAVGSMADESQIISNSGDQALAIGAISAPTTPFTLISDTCSNQVLAPAESCLLEIRFTPTSTGAFTDDVSVPSNDSANSPLNIGLSGSGSQSSSCDYDCLSGSGSVSRSSLTYAQLTGTSSIGLTNYSHYGLPAGAANPSNSFEGSLSLNIVAGTLTEQGTNLASAYTDPDSLPAFDFEFVQHGTHLVPVSRQVNPSTHPAWEMILLPGRVWDESSDNGYSRVALPFALQEINANCTHNGVMTFLFKDDGSLSRVAYQVAQETCEYFKFNLHGALTGSYSSGSVSGAAALRDEYVTQRANRLPVKPLGDLATDYPGAGVVVGNIGSDQTTSHLTAQGVYYQGTHYLGTCNTRQGNYPFCEEMALPSYSTAKTIVGGVGLMRMEQKYGGVQSNLTVSNQVTECSGSQWQDVTLLNALDMATGNYDSASDSADEGAQATIDDFFLKSSHADKVNHACGYTRKSTPGSLFVYHTSDTYLVSRGLQTYFEGVNGSSADYYADVLVEELWKPLNLSPLTWESKRTYDSTAQVWGGYGLTLIGDDFLKLGQFLLDEGKIGGQTMLDSTLLADALQQTSNGGLNTGGSTSSRYQHSLWAYDLGASSQVSCSNGSWVPYMSGFGGIGVVLLDNGMVYYYVSDNNEYGFTKTLKELTKISPVC